jgi:hypothetical protein
VIIAHCRKTRRLGDRLIFGDVSKVIEGRNQKMGELKDYSGPFKKDLKYEDFSKEVLIELMHGYAEEINLISLFFATAINKRFGEEAMREILIEAWERMAGPEMDIPRKAAKIEGNDVEAYCKLNQLAGSFPNGRRYYKYEFDLINKNRAILTVHECYACRMYETRDMLDAWDWNCKILERDAMWAYVAHVNPAMKVKELRAGRRSSPDEPACKWEFWIDEAE